MSDSSTGGYLSPAESLAPLQGDGLNTFIQPIIVGLTGLPGPMVRPALQAEPPDIPDAGQSWAAFRVTRRQADAFPFVGQEPDAYRLRRHETLDILASFYDLGAGSQAEMYCALLRDGLSISQNTEALFLAGMGIVSVGESTVVPVLVKQRWLYRVDLRFSIRREIVRVYPVQNVLTPNGALSTGIVSESIQTN